MPRVIKVGETDEWRRSREFVLRNATTGAAMTGATPTVRILKDGVEAAGAGTASEVDASDRPGTYRYAFATSEVAAAGGGLIHVSATNAVTAEYDFMVVEGPIYEAPPTESEFAEAVRDVDNTSPAASSLGAKVNAVLDDTGTSGVVVASSSKSGYSLSASGLNSISITAPSGVATTFPGMVVQLWRRFFKKVDRTATEIRTYGDNGTTVLTTQEYTDGSTQTVDAAS